MYLPKCGYLKDQKREMNRTYTYVCVCVNKYTTDKRRTEREKGNNKVCVNNLQSTNRNKKKKKKNK